jgi:glutaminyl-peptide cyclotransferase
MTPERWQRVQELFDSALERGTDADEFLRAECGEDAELLSEVRGMLAAHISGKSTDPVFADGQIVAGRYRVVRYLSRGGMGEVYEAEHLELKEHVALKTLLPAIASDARMIARFKQEIQVSRKITHANVCRVFDLERHPPDGPAAEATYFFTMAFLEGETLSARLQREGRMRPAEALPLLRQMAEALDAAHQAGVIHRDFKPSNVMLVPSSGGTRAVVTEHFAGARRVCDYTGTHDVHMSRRAKMLHRSLPESMSPGRPSQRGGSRLSSNAAPASFLIVTLAIGACFCTTAAEADGIPEYSYVKVHTYRHEADAFTEGLFYWKGFLYEGTGIYTNVAGLSAKSSIRMVRLKTGEVRKKREISEPYFGEGIVNWNGLLLQLTWRDHVCFKYDLATFAQRGKFTYPGEGWGLTQDGKCLIMSDGTAVLRFLNPETFQEIRRIPVTASGISVACLNELEWVNGAIYANVLGTDKIAIIDPNTGNLTAWINLAGLWPGSDLYDKPLNGIAYDPKGDRLFVTGKLWPYLYEIRVKK